jgi:aminopeptidase N
VTSLSPSKKRVRFAQSPRMSTYLLFLGIGDFERIHQDVDGVDVGIVVKRGDTGKAAFALEQATQLLRYYNDYFGIRFPLPKLDLIAAPGEIEGGSMENWGAIFYSQNHLLFDPGSSTELDRQEVFLVVSHEMAHQWFGDLVTMAWWDDLWLNEGFARWMQTYAADDLHPEWDTGLQAAEIYEDGKQADSVQSTHPVVQRVDTADQAMQSFDSITYNKGAAIINMLNAYVGRERFRDGVRRYMHAHAFGNTVDTDLWRVMQQAVGTPIVGIERDFARQEGVPLVRVTRTATAVNLAVSRFADDRTAISQFPPQHWRIPLAISPIGGSKSFILLRDKADLTARSPLLVNAGQMGYVRVLYSTEMFDKLVASARSLSAVDQLGLLNDAWAFALSGDSPASNVLQLAAVIPADANSVVWKRIMDIFEELDYHYQISPQRDALRQFALRMLGPLALQLRAHTSGNESSNVEILRSRLQEIQALLGDPEVIEDARRRFDSGQGTPAQLRSAVDIVAAQADAPTFEALLSRAEKTADPLEKLHLFGALADVADPALARRMIDIVISAQVPAGASANLITALARRHPDLVWRELLARFDDPQLPLSKQQRWSAAAEIAGFSSDAQRIADLQAYEERSVPPEARKPFLGSIASIRQNQRIRASVLPAIDGWIRARNPGTPSG